MGRKSKQAGGHMPLTHYERTQKFASSEYGTVQQRLAGHSQYQIGDCALTTQRLVDTAVVLCSPSGYLYAESAILEYLLQKTQELKAQQVAYENQQATDSNDDDNSKKKRIADFQKSQKVVKKVRGAVSAKEAAVNDLNRVSYWLSSAQPEAVNAADAAVEKPPDRPVSPMTGHELRRKDLWPVQLQWQHDKVCCSVSEKTIPTGTAVTAYWTDRKEPGLLVLQTVYDELLLAETKRCPVTDKKIKHTRALQKSGSSFAASGQSVQAAKYRPTIT